MAAYVKGRKRPRGFKTRPPRNRAVCCTAGWLIPGPVMGTSCEFLRFSADVPIILPFSGISDLSSPPSRFVAGSRCRSSPPSCALISSSSPASLRAWFHSSLLWPLVFRWEWSWNGPPERVGPVPCFLVAILGPDPANRLASEESSLPDAALSFPQNLCPTSSEVPFLLEG